MDVIHLFWLSLALGAGLFFGAGVLLRDLFRPTRSDSLAPTPEAAVALVAPVDLAARAELEGARAELTELRDRLQKEAERRSQATAITTADAEKLRAKIASLELELNEARTKAMGLEAEITRHRENVASLENGRDKAAEELRAAQDQLRAAKTRIVALEAAAREIDSLKKDNRTLALAAKELESARDKARDLEAALSQAEAKAASAQASIEWAKSSDADRERERAQRDKELRELQTQLRETRAQIVTLESSARDVERLRAENSSLRVELTELERQKSLDPGMDLPNFQRKNAELSLKEKLFEQRMAEFERQAEENHALRMKVENLEMTRAENEALTRRVQFLEAHSFAHLGPRRPTERPGLIRAVDPSRPELIDDTLAELVREAGCRVAVLSDLRGLLIAAAGDQAYQEELAAAASLSTFATERMRELLPMAEPEVLEWIDSNRVALRASWLRTEDDAFLLTTLSVDAPSDSAVDRYRGAISRFLANKPSSHSTHASHDHEE